MKAVSVVSASSADCRAVAQIHVDAWRAAYDGIVPSDYLANLSVDESETLWRTAVERGTPRVLVARTDDRVAGWIAYGPCRDERIDSDVGEVWAIYVDPAAWSSEIGQALWKAARQDLREQGYRSVSLWVMSNNARAIRFYERAGFAIQAESEKEFELGGVEITEVRLITGIVGVSA